MPAAREWPTNAEHSRQDAVALFLDVQHYTQRVEAAIIEGNLEEAVALNALTYKAGVKGQRILKEARREPCKTTS